MDVRILGVMTVMQWVVVVTDMGVFVLTHNGEDLVEWQRAAQCKREACVAQDVWCGVHGVAQQHAMQRDMQQWVHESRVH